ncbi:MAG: hypothetical protein A2289_22860 [Deltaproteobacteria bacterium RIFOXYA12_FULL_58_15]|nr:MAG: hypothetical protein A2289_22860 [Deltaproteobacteria bacterium RIFOXYA12_FULL_58_15]
MIRLILSSLAIAGALGLPAALHAEKKTPRIAENRPPRNAENKPPRIAEKETPRTTISSTMTLKVTDRNKAADTLIEEAEKTGGYFSSRDDDQVVLKVPVARADAFIAKIEPLGKIIDRTFNAEDVGTRLTELRTRLSSREQVFHRYFAVLNTAGQNSIVEVESQMTQLVQEIEGLKGSIGMLEHQLQLAEIIVRFEFRDRRPPARDGSSSFAWLNTVNLADLFEEFSHAK